ncbi:hypothetical protein LINPERPRIM_LOCUS10991, partial [Linum perenne]
SDDTVGAVAFCHKTIQQAVFSSLGNNYSRRSLLLRPRLDHLGRKSSPFFHIRSRQQPHHRSSSD